MSDGVVKAKKSLVRIRRLIEDGAYRKELAGIEPWGGADLVICPGPIDAGKLNLEGDVVVESPYWREIVWTVEQLKCGLAPVIDYMNKFEFYTRLGLAAKRYLDSAEPFHLKALMLSIVWEAECFLRDGGI